MSDFEITEDLANLLQIIAETDDLREWFVALHQLDDGARGHEFHRMANQMERGGEAENIVASMRLLAEPHIFAAASAALNQ